MRLPAVCQGRENALPKGESLATLMATPPIPIAAPCLGEEEVDAIREVLESGWLTQGPKVKAFEEAFARRHDVRFAVATTSCTTALHLALLALDIQPGDEVIVPAFTWVATANAVLYCGATPIFVDVLPDSYNIDATGVEAALTASSRAILPVHLFGLCADMQALQAVLPPHVRVIEDAACAAGASYKNRPAGSLGDAGCFSFHPRKAITTGEGGMITTKLPDIFATATCLRNHGATIPEELRHHSSKPHLPPDFVRLGFNYRMTDLQGAIGMAQLAKLDRFIEVRDQLAGQYLTLLRDLDWLQLPVVPPGYVHAWQAFVTLLRPDAPLSRNELMEHLQRHGISSRAGTHAVTETAFYRDRFQIASGQYPVATGLQHNTLALPLHNRMTESDVERICRVLCDL